MSDKPQVVKLAQPGIDVKTAGDEHLVYNSNWPLLKIYKQGSFTTDSLGPDFNLVVTSHDLGYVPMFWYFSNSPANAWINQGNGATQTIDPNRTEFNGPVYNTPTMTDKALMFRGTNSLGGSSGGGSVRFYYYIFALNITKNYTAPQIKSGGVIGPRNTKTVFKLAKPGKDVGSTNLEDYVVNSLGRSPLIHAVLSGQTVSDPTAASSSLTYYHNLGYVPMFFIYYTNRGALGVDDYLILRGSGDGAGAHVDEQKIKVDGFNPGTPVTIVVLKDPFELDYIIPISV